VLENQRLLVLDIALKATPTRWWGAHKETIKDWYQCKRLLRIRFGAEWRSNWQQKYNGKGAPMEHLEKCRALWKMTPPEEWPHHFVHTLEGYQQNGRQTRNCAEELQAGQYCNRILQSLSHLSMRTPT
jgi:hypothetical protein